MPPTDPTSCACGTWLSAFAAEIVLSAGERERNRATRWWRRREPCPVCNEQMTLRNNTEPGLLQGCEVHGFFIDADTVQHTSIANGIDHDAISAKLADEDAVAVANEKSLEAEQKRDAEKRAKEESERRLAKDFTHQRTAEDRRQEAENFLRMESAARALERERKQAAAGEAHQNEVAALMVGVGPEVVALFIALEKRVRTLESDKQMLETALRHLSEQVDRLGSRVTWNQVLD
jgi:hypothetical protein